MALATSPVRGRAETLDVVGSVVPLWVSIAAMIRRHSGSGLTFLLMADTHLGFDMPLRPKVQRRRRGEDFFRNYQWVLETALELGVDAVVHGGDLLFRSRVKRHLALMAFQPLLNLAEKGIPVFLVPGNHERSEIPFRLLLSHPRIYLFDRPRTFMLEKPGIKVSVAGFPQVRDCDPASIRKTIEDTGWTDVAADASLLCMHQAVEGATVGPAEYVFQPGPEVVRASSIPKGFCAILCGHIHRAQVLVRSLEGAPFPCPVLYPGSTERTSFAERFEEKGFLTFQLVRSEGNRFRLATLRFHQLVTRPMRVVELVPSEDWQTEVAPTLKELPPDSVVQIRVAGSSRSLPGLTAALLRKLAHPSQTVTLRFTST